MLMYLLFFIPLLVIPGMGFYDLLRIPVFVALLSLIIISITIKLLRKREIHLCRNPVVTAGLLFFFANIISLLTAWSFWEGVIPLILLAGYISLYGLIINAYIPRNFVPVSLTLILLAGLMFSLYGLAQRIGIDQSTLGQVVSTMGNTNYAGAFISLILPISFALCFANSGILKRGLSILVTLALFGHLILTEARGAWLAAFVGIVGIILLMFLKKDKKTNIPYINRIGVLAIVFAVFLALLVFAGRDIASKVSTIFDTRAQTNRVRLLLWRDAINMSLDKKLIGVGAGNFQIQFQPYRSIEEFKISNRIDNVFVYAENVHNNFIGILAEIGILGLITYIILIYVILRRAFFYINSVDEKGQFIELLGLLGGIIAYLVGGMFYSLGAHTSHTLYFWMFAAFCEIVGEKKARVHKKYVGETVLAIVICICVLALFSTYYAVTSAVSRYYEGKARAILHKDIEMAKNYLENSTTLNYHNWSAHYHLGNVYKKLDRYKDAMLEYETVLLINPNHPPTLNNLATLSMKFSNFAKAEEYLKQAIAIAPAYHIVYHNLGLLNLAQKKISDAIAGFKKAIEIKPQYPDSYFSMGECFLLEDDIENCIKLFVMAKERGYDVLGEVRIKAVNSPLYKKLMNEPSFKARFSREKE